MEVGDIVRVKDAAWSLQYRYGDKMLTQKRGITKQDFRWRVLAIGGELPTAPRALDGIAANDVMLVSVHEQSWIVFTRQGHCTPIEPAKPPPVVTITAPKGVSVRVDAPDGVEVRRVEG